MKDNKLKLTRQHFEFIAKVIAEISDESIRATTCLRFADHLQATNDRFQWDTFVKACKCEPSMVQVAKALEPDIPEESIDDAMLNSKVKAIKAGEHWTGPELL